MATTVCKFIPKLFSLYLTPIDGKLAYGLRKII